MSTPVLGFIGVGHLASAVVHGLCSGSAEAPRILLSPRSRDTVRELSECYPTVTVCSDNQEVANESSIVLLCTRPQDAEAALADLHLGPGSVLVSTVAGLRFARIRDLVSDEVTAVRAIPLPAVRRRAGCTAIFPPDPEVEEIFDRLGQTVPVSSEDAFDALSAATGTISALLEVLHRTAAWVSRHDIDVRDAERYVGTMALGVLAARAEDASLGELVTDHETPGGLNEELRRRWLTDDVLRSLDEALDGLYRRVAGGG